MSWSPALRACGIPAGHERVLALRSPTCALRLAILTTYNQAKSLGARPQGREVDHRDLHKSYTKEVEAPDTGEKTDEARRVLSLSSLQRRSGRRSARALSSGCNARTVESGGREADLDAFFAAIPVQLRPKAAKPITNLRGRVTMPTSLFSGFDHYHATLAHELSH